MSSSVKTLLAILSVLLVILVGVTFWLHHPGQGLINPLSELVPTPTPKPLLKYTFEALRSTPPTQSQINLLSVLDQKPDYTSYLFSFTTEGKQMTGQLNVPAVSTPAAGFPVIVMIRGFVDLSIYQTGVGTKNGAAFFASHGLVTLAPDFFGFGGSDPPNSDTWGERLEKPLNVIDLLASVPSLNFVDPQRLGLWAHSNGGQIALSVLEITGRPIPTVLWAPVSKPFPYSVLYYTDDSPDQGKALRLSLATFEQNYDVYNFSLDHYWDWLTAPIQLHQGTADTAVPVAWSTLLTKTLKDLHKDITYYTYPGADHNLQPAWNTVIAHNLEFYSEHLH